ncbi:MAG TPA: molybdopterin-dependent oxidoreductase [Paludibaculum sp.]|jgi:assimilatory nitrate reductase catalytic subunit
MKKSWKQMLGLDILADKYSYANDAEYGYTSAEKVPERWVSTTCGYCSVGCGMKVGVRDGRAVAVRGDESHPVNMGKLCPKGLSEHHTLQAKSRARYPLLKRGGRLERVTWDNALETMVGRFGEIQRKYGAQSLGVLSTGQLVTEEFYALGKLVQLGFGTSNYDGNTTLCMASAVSGYKRSFGSDGPPGAYDDLAQADLVVLIGANIADNHPILCQRLAENTGGTVIVVDPRVTKTAMLADIHLPVKPRSDIALLNGIAHVLIEEGMVDTAYVEAHTTGFAELKAHLAKYTPARVAEITGLSESQIVLVARKFGQARAPFVGWTMGVNHSTQGAETVNAICNLSLLTGKLGHAGASPFSITGQCNAMGSREASFSSALPGYRKFEDGDHRAELAAMWNVPVEEIPSKRGHAYPDVIEAMVKKQIRGLWIIATNPLVSFPNYDVLMQALGNLEFLVVQDGFHPTPTTEQADLVLPAAIWGEKEGTYTNSERRVSKVNAAVAPPGEALPDFEIFMRTAGQMGLREKLFPGWTGPADAFAEWRRVSKGRLCDYSGITYALLETRGPVQWPHTSDEHGLETRRLYSDGQFEYADGKAKLFPIEWKPEPEPVNGRYPFILNTGRTVEHWHTRTKTGAVAMLERMSPRAWLEMNPSDAEGLGLEMHDRVTIVSRRGAVSGVELRVTSIVAPGQVFLPFHFFEYNSNRLTMSAFDPISREPNFKQCAVRVERSV